MIIFWIIVFIISLIVLVKGAEWLINSSEKIGLALGLSPFVVGVTIVALGTSFPELVTSFFAVFKGVTDVVTANAVGSNITNILLVIGISAVIGKKLSVTKNLIDIDLPLLLIGTTIFLGIAYDGIITFGESFLMFVTYVIYLFYVILHREKEDDLLEKEEKEIRPKISLKDIFLLIAGVLGLVLGAKYLIDSLVNLSELLNIGTGVIALTAVAVGTSLPELLVSAKAALQKKAEVALGNIFGSNLFNLFIVVGLPGLFSDLLIDNQTLTIGVPVMIISTLLFVISGISRRIHIWEGFFYLSLYVLFIAKLFNWF